MAKIRVSIVQFLNTAPLVWGFTNGPLQDRYELSFTVPSLCAEALRAGQVDIAIIPAVEYQRMSGLVLLPDMAVAAQGEVRSILVLAKKPIESARTIALDTDSRSSVALTRLLCRGLWKISPEFIDMSPDPAAMLATADAALLIGDPALRVRLKVDELASKRAALTGTAGAENQCCGGHSSDSGDSGEQPVPGIDMLFLYDVAEQWREMTGKPCVLAVWAGRRDVVTPEVVADFQASKEYGLSHIGEIAEDAALSLDMPARYLETYLRENIDFSLDAENLAGLRHYFDLCAGAGLIPSAQPIVFAETPEGVAAPATSAKGAR
jgi:predicted solute-binding protein